MADWGLRIGVDEFENQLKRRRVQGLQQVRFFNSPRVRRRWDNRWWPETELEIIVRLGLSFRLKNWRGQQFSEESRARSLQLSLSRWCTATENKNNLKDQD